MWRWLTGGASPANSNESNGDAITATSDSATGSRARHQPEDVSSSTMRTEIGDTKSRKRKRGSFFFGFDDGVGFGGNYGGDRRLLLQGRKLAAQKKNEEQAETQVYLSQICAALQSANAIRVDTVGLSSTLIEIFRNPDTESGLVKPALNCIKLMALSKDRTIYQTLGRDNDNNSLRHILREFAVQETFLAKHGSADKEILDEVEAVLSVIDTKTGKGKKQEEGQALTTGELSLSLTQHEDIAMDAPLIAAEQEYCNTLGPQRFSFVSKLDHHFFGSLDKRRPKRLDMRKTFRELSSYNTNLPIAWGSSILVRAVEGRIDLLRACIIGPHDTPYENGCFFFDIYLGGNENTGCYPSGPPAVQFLNTCEARFPFNPHLHRDGKVCLSLLGTWPVGPGWVQGESTLLQVLVSVQSMIFVRDPVSLGPLLGGTGFGQRVTDEVNLLIRKNTVLGAIHPFIPSNDRTDAATKDSKFPYPEFEEAVKLIFD